MSYKMRPLKTSDIFIMSKIFKKMNIKFEINEDTTQTEIGVQLIQKVVENIHLAEDEVNEFMANLVGITTEEFSSLSIIDTFEIFSLFKQEKGISDFLKLAGK